MEQGKLFNLVGAMLIVFATALHIVCLVTPHFSEADCHDVFRDKVWQKLRHSVSDPGNISSSTEPVTENGLNRSTGQDYEFYIDKINFGLWELCFLFVRQGAEVDICTKWSSETIYNSDTKDLDSIGSKGWTRAAQAMAIIGTLMAFMGITLAIVNMLVKSKGDRQRLIHIFIASGCFATGGFLLLGNFIVAANYKDAIVLPDDPGVYPPLVQFQEILRDHSFLSWGFALDVVAFALSMLAGVAHLIGGRIVNIENGIV
ncbi:uncharacterized protein LOC106080066 [Biomphalaria glabrata]|uniref:Uncharacterized protein LOC106080066 n=1 Tax=Biomphalaria glabrata TaxID=6526 RepID=A0A9W2Z6G2_BIOGL|nr:uncharacterized protein LOC106080066 [Biomphalaria glabrata]